MEFNRVSKGQLMHAYFMQQDVQHGDMKRHIEERHCCRSTVGKEIQVSDSLPCIYHSCI